MAAAKQNAFGTSTERPEKSKSSFNSLMILFFLAAVVAALGYAYIKYSPEVVDNVDDVANITPIVTTDDYELVVEYDDIGTIEVNEKEAKKHIIFMLADDLGWNSVGYMDYDLSFATPHLSALASQGIIMDNYYAQEVCTPARASLLTGRHPLSVGMQYSIIMPTTAWGLGLEEKTVADVLGDAGWKTHAIGKWHLGHFSPRYLPTARGFDSFIGYLSGENYYWSKHNPDHDLFTDFMYSDKDCYTPYEQDDLHTYSTFLYRDKAISIINDHNETDSSLFIYLAWQAVHDPFMDKSHYQNGIPKEYLGDGVYDKIREEVVGHKRRQYAMALSLLDDAVGDIVDTLDDKGMLNTTYIIFTSDNGGCYIAGGKNGPLRGTKGSLFEGGVRVDAFIYSPLLHTSLQGYRHTPLAHISDWFPTILNLTGITFIPKEGYELDGLSHVGLWIDAISNTSEPGYVVSTPRSHVLYNYYYDVQDSFYDKWVNGSFAIRNDKYKLMHTYDAPDYGDWFDYAEKLENDDSLAEAMCSQTLAANGIFTYFLFDLENDPYETTNLYDDESDEIEAAKTELYAYLEAYEEKSNTMSVNVQTRSMHTMPVWKDHNNYMMPWVNEDDIIEFKGTYPEDCYHVPTFAPTTLPPTKDPTVEPTLKPTRYPTMEPTIEPTERGDTSEPTYEATPEPSHIPTTEPTLDPTSIPTVEPTDTDAPTTAPTASTSTDAPTISPTQADKNGPTPKPTGGTPTYTVPTFSPPNAQGPTMPTMPTTGAFPTFRPDAGHEIWPTPIPTMGDTDEPTLEPTTLEPTAEPTPTLSPTIAPTTASPSRSPTAAAADDDEEDDDKVAVDDEEDDDKVTVDDDDEEEVDDDGEEVDDDEEEDDDEKSPTHSPTHTPTRSPTAGDDDEEVVDDDEEDDDDEVDDDDEKSPTHSPTHTPTRSPTAGDDDEAVADDDEEVDDDDEAVADDDEEVDDDEKSPTHKPSYKPTSKPTPLYDDDDTPVDDWTDDDDEGDDGGDDEADDGGDDEADDGGDDEADDGGDDEAEDDGGGTLL